MNQTPILRYPASKVISYADYKLEDFWEGNEPKISIFSDHSAFFYKDNRLESLKSCFSMAKETICLLWKELPEQEILHSLLQMKESQGIRIYLLTSTEAYHADEGQFQPLAGHFLIRIIGNSLGNLILTDPHHNSKGFAVSENPFKPEQAWIYELPSETIAQAFHFFSHSFWTEATYEIRRDGPIETGTPPYDLPPILNPSHILYNTESRNTLLEFFEQAQQFQELYLCSAQFESDNPYVNWFLSQKATQKACFCPITTEHGISQVATLMSQHDIPIFSLTHKNDKFAPFQGVFGKKSENAFEGIYFLNSLNAPQKSLDLALRLDESTAQECFQWLQSSCSIGQCWTYHKTKPLGEIEHSVIQWKTDATQIIEIPEKYRETKDLDSLEAKQFEDFENKATEPVFPAGPEPLSKHIEYSWQVIPPRRSKNAKKDSLYKDWENFQENISSCRELLQKQLEDIQEKRSGLKDKIGKLLKRFFVSKEHKFSGIQKELEHLTTEEINTSQKAEEAKKQLESIFTKLQGHGKEFDAEIDKAEKQAKWEEDRAKWNKQKEDAEQRKGEIEGEIQTLKQELEDTEKAVSEFSNKIDNLKKEKETIISDKTEQENILKRKNIESEIQSADPEENAEVIGETDDEAKSVNGEKENGKEKSEKSGEEEL